MNISKLLKKIKFAQFEEVKEEHILNNLPQAADPTIPDSTNISPNNVANIPTSPPIKSKGSFISKIVVYKDVYLYLQLIPKGVNILEITPLMKSLGYAWKYGNFSKRVAPDQLSNIEQEFTTIESNGYNVEKDALIDLQNRNTGNTETPVQSGETNLEGKTNEEKIETIKEAIPSKQYKITKEYVDKQIENLFNNFGSEETQKFLDEQFKLKTITADGFHPYSLQNNYLIMLQNKKKNPITGEIERNSGYVASKTNWKKIGRIPKEGESGMYIFRPDIKKITAENLQRIYYLIINLYQSELNKPINEVSNLLGTIRSNIDYKNYRPSKNKISYSDYIYIKNELSKTNQFKTLNDFINLLEEKISGVSDKNESIDSLMTGFKFEPIALDMNQTQPDPEWKGVDFEEQANKVRSMWMGLDNKPSEKIDALSDTLIKAISEGKVGGKNINVSFKNTGRSGGYSANGEIAIDKLSQGLRRFKTLVHEVAHEYLHWGKRTDKKGRINEEIQADLTAMIILNYYGFPDIQTTTNYLKNVVKDKKDLTDAINEVLAASNAIISSIEEEKLEVGTNIGGENLMQAKNWYERIKLAHYSEKEKPGEGYGGEGQFQARYIEDRARENEEWIKLMRAAIKEDLRTRSQDRTNRVMQRLLDIGYARQNIISWILGPAMHGIKVR